MTKYDEELTESILPLVESYAKGTTTRKNVEYYVDTMVKLNNFGNKQYIIDLLDEIDEEEKNNKTANQLDRKRFWYTHSVTIIGVIIAIAVLFGIFKFGVWLFSDLDSDNDGYTNDFEERNDDVLDKNEYNWNVPSDELNP